MADILQDFPIRAPVDRVFDAVSTSRGLNSWWTDACSGQPELGASYTLGFGPMYQWRAIVTRCETNVVFELTMAESDADWRNTRVGFALSPTDGGTQVRFTHLGWPEANEHYRISSHCWALYLRLLRRYVEHGEIVPYANRLDA